MTPILDRIRAHGGEVIRDKWEIRLRPGRLTPAAIAWIKDRTAALTAEVWPEFDTWVERAAIKEFCAGRLRAEAEQEAYQEVMGC